MEFGRACFILVLSAMRAFEADVAAHLNGRCLATGGLL